MNRGHFLRNALLACLSPLVALGIAEMRCRQLDLRCVPFGYYRMDPQTGLVVARPGYAGVFYSENGAIRIRTNALGFRGGLFDPRDTAGEKVLFLGDSFVQALNTPVDSTFASRVARALPCQAVQAGIPGWGQGDELLWLKSHGGALNPDVVVLCVFLGNDLSVDNISPGHVSSNGYTVDSHGVLGGRDTRRSAGFNLLERTLYRSDLFWILRARVSDLGYFVRVNILHHANYRSAPYLKAFLSIYQRSEPERKIYYDVFFDLIHEFARLGAERHFRLVVVTIPWDYTLDEARFASVISATHQSRGDFDPALADRIVGDYMSAHGMEYVSLAEAFRARGDPLTAYSRRDGHFSPRGHRWTADALVRELATGAK